jgi:hypothetical protein
LHPYADTKKGPAGLDDNIPESWNKAIDRKQALLAISKCAYAR